MRARSIYLPLIVVLAGVTALAMYVPAIFAAVSRDWLSARAFFYSGTIVLSLTAMVALALANRSPAKSERKPLIDIVAAFVGLPVVMALPVWEIGGGELTLLDSYFEMVSSFTTTGASVVEGLVPDAVHLWRALVAWLGGFLVWVAAVAILAPLSLGGFEVLRPRAARSESAFSQIAYTADISERLLHFAARLAPIYSGLTIALWFGLFLLGDRGLVALCHAMSTLSTSGISPVGGQPGASSGFGGELLILVFFAFALSRRTFSREATSAGDRYFWSDPELRLGLLLAATVSGMLFLRHWVGAVEAQQDSGGWLDGLRALWGGAFTVLSFMTTTGFESASWEQARDWSGLRTPGLIFLGLALVGGGVATTAGGVKLLRVHVLYRHGQRELERLVHPSSVGSVSGGLRSEWRQGAFMAWIFFMLFALSVAVVMLALSLTGIGFDSAVVLTIAALSTTGPLANVAVDQVLIYSTLTDAAKLILSASMILGRLETLAIISLFNPEFWRN
ncbi:Potassium uptake protein TrkH [Candidatus Rhodobacter oscarellae]|uniref:Potassium uptake protein TrkH n=1 Tax=Candidatus Rhodobacter oscarellae TaxID=1675527 RepID=A0A0J9E3J9_9RHOB|nr:potassium transporter TrkG [Candidatus Rhodobacter lobularis]KMW57355.1 Potassium uptake protein TrkH [Candidatus Rhodobacter lobularis]